MHQHLSSISKTLIMIIANTVVNLVFYVFKRFNKDLLLNYMLISLQVNKVQLCLLCNISIQTYSLLCLTIIKLEVHNFQERYTHMFHVLQVLNLLIVFSYSLKSSNHHVIMMILSIKNKGLQRKLKEISG